MFHVREGSLGDSRELLADDARGLRFHGRSRGRFLGRAIDGDESFARRFVLEPLLFLLCRPLGGEKRGLRGLDPILLFPLFALLLLLGGSLDGLILVHHFLEERLAGLLRAATADDGRAAVAFFHGYRRRLGRLLRTGSAFVSLEPDHPLQLDGGIFLDGARGGLHAYLELVLQELDRLRAALSEIPGQLVDSYLIH
jgi:hypothetical protein